MAANASRDEAVLPGRAESGQRVERGTRPDPGYPFLAAPFQALGIIRWAQLFYGALACLGMFIGARRWLGRFRGFAAVGLYCSSGAALLFAWREYMPTFTDASLIAAGSGILLWSLLATEASTRLCTWAGLAAFAALEIATFARYTDIVILGCAVVTVMAAWRLRAVLLPLRTLCWWLATVVVFGAGVAVFDDLVYGGPLTTGYHFMTETGGGFMNLPPGVAFGFSAIMPNVRLMPAHLIQAIPVLVLGLVAVALIVVRWPRPAGRRDIGGGRHGAVRRGYVVVPRHDRAPARPLAPTCPAVGAECLRARGLCGRGRRAGAGLITRRGGYRRPPRCCALGAEREVWMT